MPFPRPTLASLIASALADLQRLPNADITLRRSVVQVLAYMVAAQASGEYDYLDWMVQNVLLPDTATGTYLDRWANILGLQRLAPQPAIGTVTFTGNPGLVVAAGTVVQTSNSGVVITTTAAGTIGSGNNVTVAASAAPGSAGNILAATPLTMQTAQAGVLGAATAATAFTGGTDAEIDAALRVRVLQRTANPPQGGAAYDYVSWAELVSGVTRVWVYPLYFGNGTVGITFVMDGRPVIVPLSGDVANVQASIVAYCPVTAVPTAFAPSTSSVNVAIHNLQILSGYTLAVVKANIAAALAALFATVTPGGLGWDSTQNAFVTGGLLYLNQIYNAISNAAGVASFDLTTPSADQAAGFAVLIQLGSVTYT